MEKEAHIIKKEIITKQAILLDVREVNEWQDGHFVQAKSYPLSLLLNKIPDDIDPNTHIYIHCAHGRRAEHAMKILLPFFPNAYALSASIDTIAKKYNLEFSKPIE